MNARFLAVMLLLIGIFACQIPQDPVPHYLPALEPFDPDEEGWNSSRPVLLVSDCQLHNLYSMPIPERNLSLERLADTAIRPPQLDMYATDVLRWILEHGAGDTEAIIHVGDALDLACDGELQQFLEVMKDAGKPWLMVPGNHECYHLGTYDPRNPAIWNAAAYKAGSPITKDRYIRLYVAALLSQDDPGMADLAKDLRLHELKDLDVFELENRIPDRFSWEAPAGLGEFLEAIVWNIDIEKPWRSFVLQRAELSGRGPEGLPLKAVLMDSCQYAELPALVPNAWDNYLPDLSCGMTGELLADQLRIIRQWVDSEEECCSILVAHHPLNDIASKSRSSLLWLWGHAPITKFISSHTHSGHFYVHDLGDDKSGLELNVGSTTDWPMEWRTLMVYAKGEEVYIKSEYFMLVDVLKNRKGFFDQDWEIPLGADDDYRKYKIGETSYITFVDFLFWYHLWPPVFGRPEISATKAAYNTEVRVKNTMLWTYHRLIRTFPTNTDMEQVRWPEGCRSDENVKARIALAAKKGVPIERKIDLLIELEQFEKTRSTVDPNTGQPADDVRLRYKISQAVWASRYERNSGRTLQPDDDLIRLRIAGHEGRPVPGGGLD